MTKTAYSYIRFSQVSQAKGGSLERQDSTASEYAARKGLRLDTTLNMRDLGVSGFTGKNITDGALGTFVKALHEGKVAPGSFLLVEDIDRLSRLPVMEALAVFQSIINGGVTVVTLKNEQEYSRESLHDDWIGLMPILVSMGRANEESTRKSALLGKAWRKKKEAAAENLTPLGNNAPMWLTYTKEGGYVVDETRAALIRRIFSMSIAGRGRTAIVKILNRENIPSFRGMTWGTTSVNRLLENRALLGEYQPCVGSGKRRTPFGPPVVGYFPTVVDESTFNQAQAASDSRYVHRSTRQPTNFNVWSGIARCALCTSTMTIVKKGVPPMGYSYLACTSNRKGKCKAKPVRLDRSELVYREILAKVGDKSLAEDESAAVANHLQAKQGKLKLDQIKHATTLTIFEEEPSKAVGAVLSKQQAAIEQLEDEIKALKLTLAADTITDKAAFFAALDLENFEGRAQTNALLKRLKILVYINGRNRFYGIDQDGHRILDIYESPETGILFYPVSSATSAAVQDQEGDFTPALITDDETM